MSVPAHISQVITRLVKPEGSKLSTRETIEAHADKICNEHNATLKMMLAYLDTGEQKSRIKEWAQSFDRNNAKDVATMRGVLTGAILPEPKFQGLSDAAALEVYGRLLVNLFCLEVAGQRPLA